MEAIQLYFWKYDFILVFPLRLENQSSTEKAVGTILINIIVFKPFSLLP